MTKRGPGDFIQKEIIALHDDDVHLAGDNARCGAGDFDISIEDRKGDLFGYVFLEPC